MKEYVLKMVKQFSPQEPDQDGSEPTVHRPGEGLSNLTRTFVKLLGITTAGANSQFGFVVVRIT